MNPLRTVGNAVSDRVQGNRPGALRAFGVAAVAGITVAVITYRLLRSD